MAVNYCPKRATGRGAPPRRNGRWLSAAALVLAFLFSGCPAGPGGQPTSTPEATPQASPAASPTPTATSTAYPSQQVVVTNRVFFDYNGNGTRDGGEPPVAGIGLTYQPGNIGCASDKNGLGTVRVPAGSYTVSVDDPSGKFKYILRSPSEFSDIGNGLKVDISEDGEVSVPLAQGFLTWPFPAGVSYGSIYFWQPEDPSIDPLSMCDSGT